MTAIGGSLISALAIGAMVVVGVLADPVAPPAEAATALTTFEDCDALQAWYVDHTLDQVGPYGWGGRRWMTMREDSAGTDEPMATGSDSAKTGIANGPTGTNTQETGVDEPDVAKTDGRLVVRLQDDRRVVITDVSGSSPREIGDWRIPSSSYVDGLLLVGNHVLLAGSHLVAIDYAAGNDLGVEDLGGRMIGGRMTGSTSGTEVFDLDVSDAAHPRLDSRTTWSGQQLSLRQYGDTVRLVTSTGLPRLPFVHPRPGRLTENQAERRNREIVRSSTVDDWVPGFSSEAGASTGSLVGCHEFYHPKTWSGSDTVAVATFRPGDVGAAKAVAVTGAGAEVYSSADRLYVTSTDWGGPLLTDGPRSSDQPDSTAFGRSPAPTRTHIHAFALDGETTRYVASGSIVGSIRDRWSLDEYDGHLRVAISLPDRVGGTRENGIVVLEENDGRLEPVGELRGLGVDEEIQSVRWFDDLAVLVTFRQMDPLYTIDLGDPTHPTKLGALKIPGFSSYLHPIGGDRLLGIGTDATDEGRSRGAQAGVFDLGDPSHAHQLGRTTFGEESQLGASEDPHAFTWLPGSSAAITSLQRWNQASPGLVLLRVSPNGDLSTERLPSPGGRQPRALPLDGGRVALVGSTVRILDLEG